MILLFILVSSVAPSGNTIIVNQTLDNAMVNHSSPSQTNEPLIISSNSQMASESISGAGTRSDPYILEGRELLLDDTCVRIENTTEYFILQGGEYTVQSEEQDYNPVIVLSNVHHGTIRGSHIIGGYNGIRFHNVEDCSIIECTITHATKGISEEYAENCTVRDSVVFHNEIGLDLQLTTNSHFVNNTIFANLYEGIDFGFYSENNTVFDNSIGWNHGWNAVDNGYDNEFTNGLNQGNAWSDFNGTGVYQIHGNSLSTDISPEILFDGFRPVIYGISDRIVDVESTDEVLTWQCEDHYPDSYQISINNQIEVEEVWDGQDITLRVDQLPIGTYEIILNVTDASGRTNADIVTITILSFMLGGIGTNLVMIASGITVAVFLILVVVIKKFL